MLLYGGALLLLGLLGYWLRETGGAWQSIPIAGEVTVGRFLYHALYVWLSPVPPLLLAGVLGLAFGNWLERCCTPLTIGLSAAVSAMGAAGALCVLEVALLSPPAVSAGLSRLPVGRLVRPDLLPCPAGCVPVRPDLAGAAGGKTLGDRI